MSFAEVPGVSKKQIDKAGQSLTSSTPTVQELRAAIRLTEAWRACHAYPINTFQSTLRTKVKGFANDPIVAQRLKRMPTIIDKLRRHPNMKLTTMQDIGGVRAILESIDDVYRLANEYRHHMRFAHELVNDMDYIQDPRSEDGYRSLHLIYKYRNLQNPDYDGLRLELQIRTKLQHTWATAVETMGTFLGQALKSRQGDQDWLDFFAVTSSAFAYMENSACVSRFAHLSERDTFVAVANAEARLGALRLMDGFSKAARGIWEQLGKETKWSYHLIVLNSLEKTIEVRPYDRDSQAQAIADYSAVEEAAAGGEKIEPVLVSAGRIETLRRAYPNFFLDIGDFSARVEEIKQASGG